MFTFTARKEEESGKRKEKQERKEEQDEEEVFVDAVVDQAVVDQEERMKRRKEKKSNQVYSCPFVTNFHFIKILFYKALRMNLFTRPSMPADSFKISIFY